MISIHFSEVVETSALNRLRYISLGYVRGIAKKELASSLNL
jgi:hypothetical protein